MNARITCQGKELTQSNHVYHIAARIRKPIHAYVPLYYKATGRRRYKDVCKVRQGH